MKAHFSLFAIPQRFTNNKLQVNILILPRNFDPLIAQPMLAPFGPWVEANLKFKISISDGLQHIPRLDVNPAFTQLMDNSVPTEAKDIFQKLKQDFDITSTSRAEKPSPNYLIKKYVPKGYFDAAGIKRLQHPNAVTDDSYQCAMKKSNEPISGFEPSSNAISWGKAFGYCMKNEKLARKCGFLYSTELENVASYLQNGGWLYVDLAESSDYYFADHTKLIRYAARIPAVKPNEKRAIFSSSFIPVRHDEITPAPDNPGLPHNLDQIIGEMASYHDGFAKRIHASQPFSEDPFEDNDSTETPIYNDQGIQLAWDDEQLLTWYNRLLEADPDHPDKYVNAPLAILGYRVDVRRSGISSKKWYSLCAVRANKQINFGSAQLYPKNTVHEQMIEVYPSIPDGNGNNSFWLPIYFCTWNGGSLVLPDSRAILLYNKNRFEDAEMNAKLHDNYSALDIKNSSLRYGRSYDFRVRLVDFSGGGPEVSDHPASTNSSSVTSIHFKRHCKPHIPTIINAEKINDLGYFEDDKLVIARPKLTYPSALFTGYPNAFQLCLDDLQIYNNTYEDNFKNPNFNHTVGIPDPDVYAVKINVFVRLLSNAATLRSNQPIEGYSKLYYTIYRFDKAIQKHLSIPIKVKTVETLLLENPETDAPWLAGLNKSIIIPANREVLIEIAAICADKKGYYASDSVKSSMPTTIKIIHHRTEKSILQAHPTMPAIRGLLLKTPDNEITDKPLPEASPVNILKNALADNSTNSTPRLSPTALVANNLGLPSINAAIFGDEGERWQFGANSLLNHSLSPDNTNIHFTSQKGICEKWIIPLVFQIKRDWAWQGINDNGIEVFRKFYTPEFQNPDSLEYQKVGQIIPAQGVQFIEGTPGNFTSTFYCYFDALEKMPFPDQLYPSELMVAYKIVSHLREEDDDFQNRETLLIDIHLPISSNPTQVPVIVSAGLASSPYTRDQEKYAFSQPRQQFLWVEFSEIVQNPADRYFCRFIGNSPDPLLAKWDESWINAKFENEFPIKPDELKVVYSDHSDDRSGLTDMQELIPSTTSERHFLMPLPKGLKPDDPELFGFFSYEFRLGHKEGWSIGQARYGPALFCDGIQFPTPSLPCIPFRHTDGHIGVTSTYARAVFSGRNITSVPPRTQVWAILYCQCQLTDGSDYRNIFLGEKLMTPSFDLIDEVEGSMPCVATWSKDELYSKAHQYGLGKNPDFSVLCVEVLPSPEQFIAHRDTPNFVENHQDILGRKQSTLINDLLRFASEVGNQNHRVYAADSEYLDKPLSEDLGNYRFLRSSNLVALSSGCCIDCD